MENEATIYHYGVKGMKWEDKEKISKWNGR